MNVILLYIVIFVSYAPAFESLEVTFWERSQYKGANITRTYKDGCVNLGVDWINRANSINTYGRCVSLHTRTNCAGDSAIVQADNGARNSLGKFADKVASFKKCPSVQIQLGVRPQYNVSFSKRVMSGECSVYQDWEDRNVLVHYHCLKYFKEVDCRGTATYRAVSGVQSFRTCDLTLINNCEPLDSCPKYLYKNSVEYNFWSYLFSIYSPTYRKTFLERVKNSTDGFISWDFLFAPNKSASSLGDQYLDAIESQFSLLRILRASYSGTLGFNEKNLATLRALAAQVRIERSKEFEEYSDQVSPLDDPNWYVFKALEDIWSRFDNVYIELVNYWISRRGDARQREVKFFSDMFRREILYSYGDQCVNMRADWLHNSEAIDTYGHCVSVYRDPDCKGLTVDLHTLGRGLNDMREVDFDHRIASFEKCRPYKEIQIGRQPNYWYFQEGGKLFDLRNGECVTLAAASHHYYFDCFVVFSDKNCRESPNYYYDSSRSFYDNVNVKGNSLKLCELNVQRSPSCEWCPKRLLSKGSTEYAFWWYLFSVYSPAYRQKFVDQLENLPSDSAGYIKWNFLFTSNTSTISSNLFDQYADALESQIDIFRSLYASLPGTLGFSVEHLETLIELAERVYEERRQSVMKGLDPLISQNSLFNTATRLETVIYRNDQQGKYLYDHSEKDRYNVALLKLLNVWATVQNYLKKIVNYWTSEYKVGTTSQFRTDEQRQVTFFERPKYKGANVTYNYAHRCVNMKASWINRANSLDSKGQCINVYTKTNCEGDSNSIQPIGRGQDSMGKFGNRVASFRRCDSNTQIKLDTRPRYYLTGFDEPNFRGDKEVFGLPSGRCLTLPKKWHRRVSSLASRGQCFVLFDDVDCKGNTRYSFPSWIAQNNLREANFNDRIKSIKTCEVTFDASCSQCPRLLKKFGFEYNFWVTLFSIYSRTFREQFEARVRRSYDGFISWDFIFSSNATAETFGDQYQDILENHLRLFRILLSSRSGKWGFNTENVETLLAMATNIRRERKEEWLNMLKSGQNDNDSFIMLYYLEQVWGSFEQTLNDISKAWNLENNDAEICGIVEDESEPIELSGTETLINDGETATYGDDPWHVAIYRKEKGRDQELICGGTLISPTIVVTAAHCLYNRTVKSVQKEDRSNHLISVAKFTRDFATNDGPSQKMHEIEELITNPKAYSPDGTKTHGADIILIVLKEPIVIDNFIRPICLDWDGRIFESLLDNKVKGRIVGWGSVLQNDHSFSEYSQYLRKADLVYIGHDACIGKVKHLNVDNFCGGSPKDDDGPGARKGDSGGGFVFKYKNRYYLRGIVSTRDSTSKSSVSAFTDVSTYIPWIRNYV